MFEKCNKTVEAVVIDPLALACESLKKEETCDIFSFAAVKINGNTYHVLIYNNYYY